jgi:hypothetical protein
MKANEIKIGEHYLVKVNGAVRDVRVDGTREVNSYRRGVRTGTKIMYKCTNIVTGRKLVIRSAAKFRGVCPPGLRVERRRNNLAAIDAANAKRRAEDTVDTEGRSSHHPDPHEPPALGDGGGEPPEKRPDPIPPGGGEILRAMIDRRTADAADIDVRRSRDPEDASGDEYEPA